MKKYIMEAAVLASAALDEGREPVIIVALNNAEDLRKALRDECGADAQIEDEVSSSRSIVQMRIKKAKAKQSGNVLLAAAEKP